MRHQCRVPKLGRPADQRKAMLRALTTQLIREGRLTTTKARAKALLEGRLVPSVADVAAMAKPVLKHRMALSFAARARGETLSGLIDMAVSRSLGLEAAA